MPLRRHLLRLVFTVAVAATSLGLLPTPTPKEPTQVSFHSDLTPAGHRVKMTITVSRSRPGSEGVPQGSITLLRGSTVIRSADLPAGTHFVDLDIGPYDGGKYTFTAKYSGNDRFLPSTSEPYVKEVPSYPLEYAVTSSVGGTNQCGPTAGNCAPGAATGDGEPVTFYVSCYIPLWHLPEPPGGIDPTGSAMFFIDREPLAKASFDQTGPRSWSASYTTSALEPGTYSVHGEYAGDRNFAAMVSPPVIGHRVVPDVPQGDPPHQARSKPSAATPTPDAPPTLRPIAQPAPGNQNASHRTLFGAIACALVLAAAALSWRTRPPQR